nr:hypothetical protein [Tanacetum cinerariifolium]
NGDTSWHMHEYTTDNPVIPIGLCSEEPETSKNQGVEPNTKPMKEFRLNRYSLKLV